MANEKEHCVICYKTVESIAYEPDELSKNVTVIFILTKLLNISSSTCEKLLIENGTSPSQWIYCCNKCTTVVEEAKSVYRQILELQSKIFNLQKSLEIEIRESTVKSIITNQWKLVDEVRDMVVQRILPEEIGNNELMDATTAPLEKIKVELEMQSEDDWISTANDDDFIPGLDITQAVSTFEENLAVVKPKQEGRIVKNIKRKYKKKREKEMKVEKLITTDIHQCTYCPATFAFRTDLTGHVNMVHIKSVIRGRRKFHEYVFTCKICGEKFESMLPYRRHRRRAHAGTNNYGCPQCSASFRNEKSVKLHQIEKHGLNVNPSRPWVCRHCSKDFTDKQKLLRHESSVHDRPSFICEICSKTCKNELQLQYHQIRSHPQEDHQVDPERTNRLLEKMTCMDCNRSFCTPSALNNHRKMYHEKTWTYFCSFPDCTFGCITQSRLKGHMAIHEGKNFQCEQCGKKYTRKGMLTIHMRSHTGELPFKCPVLSCNKGYAESSNFIKHVRNHNKNNVQR